MKILIPLPNKDFDPTEVAVSWKILNSFPIVFSTPNGTMACPDLIMINGEGLGIFSPFLVADKNGQKAMKELKKSQNFNNPIPYHQINPFNFDALLLPGGHAQGMKEYLESKTLHKIVGHFFDYQKPVAAICHGTVLAARSFSSITGKSVLYGLKSTALLQSSELLAWFLTKKKLGNYYRTYFSLTVEKEVKQSLMCDEDFKYGPPVLFRDSTKNLWPGFYVQDGLYLSARWPGDVHVFATKFKKILNNYELVNSDININKWKLINQSNGIWISSTGKGSKSIVIIPGMEGSGESCIDMAESLIDKNKYTIFIVDYSREQFHTLEQLSKSLSRIFDNIFGKKEIIILSQSFGNVLSLKISEIFQGNIEKALHVSFFTSVPKAKIKLAIIFLKFAPNYIYKISSKYMCTFLLGPSKEARSHPFFKSVYGRCPKIYLKRIKWLKNLELTRDIKQSKFERFFIFGMKDRVVSAEQQIKNLKFETGDKFNFENNIFKLEKKGHIFLKKDIDEDLRKVFNTVLH